MGVGLIVKFLLYFNTLRSYCGVRHWTVWLLALLHHTVKKAKRHISIHSQLPYIMECRQTNVLFEVPANCVTQD